MSTGAVQTSVQTSGQVEPFPKAAADRGLSEQLGQLRHMLQSEFPDAEGVTLSFDGHLRAHIDIRKGEEILCVESKLAGMAGGIFSQIQRGPAPHHPFLHRISALVDR
ncbi:hypothetical protein [Croceicoccus sp. Ery5]|uniref:hypothetical protein n=1 Tax=Croceicoccus sp. Ery5 TaxID=1703340 RepID=UPI001E61CF67|nr:hypothetical protein [Croceicoccus sp. Ery5]